MNIVKEDFRAKEVQALSMAISKNGLFGLFCGPYNILLLALDDSKIKRKVPINKSIDPMLCQWNKSHNEKFAITLNNVCKIYDAEMNKIQSLKAHNKSISFIDWHPMAQNQIATSSIDMIKSLCIWDIRNSKSPSLRVDTQGINRIKWNKVNSHSLGTIFNSEILIWDDRKLSSPINTLLAHSSDINDFDWHNDNKNILISCGEDRKLKTWNFYDDLTRPINDFEEDQSFSQLKFDTLGNIMTLTASDNPTDNQVAYRDGSDFYKLCQTQQSTNIITSFAWKVISEDQLEFVTLHRNSDFKTWQIDKAPCFAKRQRGASYMSSFENSFPSDRFDLSPSPDNPPISSSRVASSAQIESFGPQNKADPPGNMVAHHSDPNLVLREKMNKVVIDDLEMRRREIDKLSSTNQTNLEKNFESRSVIANFSLLNIKCSIQFTYRTLLDDSVFLDVVILPGRAEKIRPQNLEELEKILKATAEDCKTNNILPIEKCIDVATDYLNKLSSRFSLRAIRLLKEQSNAPTSYCNLPDVKVPFPRICGATFSASGLLVCFMSPPGYMSRFHSTPRSLADVTKHSNQSSSTKGFLYDFNAYSNKTTMPKVQKTSLVKKWKTPEFNVETSGRKLSSQTNQKLTHPVYVYNATPLSVFSPHLARTYSMEISNIDIMCQKNCFIVAENSRKDLIEFWQYCVILANGCKSNYDLLASQIKPWSSQLMGRGLCEMWFDHFMKINDIQSAAMLILVMKGIDTDLDSFIENKFSRGSPSLVTNNMKNISQESLMDNSHSDNLMTHFPMQNYYAFHSSAMNDSNFRNVLPSSGRYGNHSFGENDHSISKRNIDMFPDIIRHHKEHFRLLDPAKNLKYNRILLHYVQLLTAQNLLSIAAKIVQKIMPISFVNSISDKTSFNVLLLKNCQSDHRCRSVCIDNTNATVICTECPSRGMALPNPDLVIKTPIVCSVCRVYVRGLFAVCSQCNHGGHTSHLNSWFSRSDSVTCPTGCGCFCLFFKDVFHDSPAPTAVI